MRKKNKINFIYKEKIAVLVDGETEFWYFQMIKRNHRDLKVDIRPEIPQKKKIDDQYKRIVELSDIYDKVVWIVDLDVIISEGLINKMSQYRTSLEKDYKNIIIIYNQPCLEYWLVLHFKFSQPHFSNCDEAGKILKKNLINYEKTESFYTRQNDDIYLKLKKFLPKAIGNSMKCGNFDLANPQIGFSEMHKLFDVLKLSSL